MMDMSEEKCSREPRHNELKSMLSHLRTVTDHINELSEKLGVSSVPKATSAPTTPSAAPQPPKLSDNLISVLNMLPDAVRREVEILHSAISDLEENLL